MQVIKRVTVKQVLTEKSRDEHYKRLEAEKKRCLNECEQLDFEKRKALKYSAKGDRAKVLKRFQEEVELRKDKIRSLEFQMEQLHILPLGTEIVEKEMETLQNVNVGDDWEQVIAPAVIVIKDGKVIEIRS